MKSAEYIKKATNFKETTKWPSIHLQNLADEIPASEIPALMEKVRVIAISEAQTRVDKLTELKAPPIILDAEIKKLEKAKAGKATVEAILRRSLNKRSK